MAGGGVGWPQAVHQKSSQGSANARTDGGADPRQHRRSRRRTGQRPGGHRHLNLVQRAAEPDWNADHAIDQIDRKLGINLPVGDARLARCAQDARTGFKRLRLITMPCAVFCVSNWPVMPSSGVSPAWSLPRHHAYRVHVKPQQAGGPILKAVLVCSDRANSPAVSPLADSAWCRPGLRQRQRGWLIARRLHCPPRCLAA